MSKGLIDIIMDSIIDEKFIGKTGEFFTGMELQVVNLMGRKGKTLKNIYIPKENNETTEIDLIYITQKGIFVFESKNYSGWIFGNEKDQYWTAMLPNKEKNKFYNPIKQNRSHIKWLSEYLNRQIPMFSVIVFSNRCELKKLNYNSSSNLLVIKRDDIYAAVREIWDETTDSISEQQIEDIYSKLSPLTNVDNAIKLLHIQNIENKYVADDHKSMTKKEETPDAPVSQSNDMICPLCGKELVLRVAKKGINAGKQFYGCSGFPKCRYTSKCSE